MTTIQLPSEIQININNGQATCDINRVERIANAFLKTISRNHDVRDDSATAAKLAKLIGGKIICR
jgi:hypothetical protein